MAHHNAVSSNAKSKLGGAAYSPRYVTNRKSRGGRTLKERQNQRARREYARLCSGMAGQDCWFITITCGRYLDLNIRKDVWHSLRTRLRQQWPTAEAWTATEWSQRRGVHLHAVVKGTPGLTLDWVDHLLGLRQDGAAAFVEQVRPDTESVLARYLTKQFAQPQHIQHWPRGFHPFSATRGWCTSSQSRKQ